MTKSDRDNILGYFYDHRSAGRLKSDDVASALGMNPGDVLRACMDFDIHYSQGKSSMLYGEHSHSGEGANYRERYEGEITPQGGDYIDELRARGK